MQRRVAGTTVHGVDVGPETRCGHYDGERDVVAIRFPCCDRFYPCFRCHAAIADHDAERWSPNAFDAPAIRCGACGSVLSISTYRETAACPDCGAGFNPNCTTHEERYFAVSDRG